MPRILISPWGNPSTWGEVEYIFGNINRKGKTTLSAVAEVIKPERTLIFTLDTLADLNNNPSGYREVIESSRELITQKIKEFGIDNLKPKIYILPGIGQFPNGEFKGSAEDIYYIAFKHLAEELLNFRNSEKIEVYFDSTHGLNYMTVSLFSAMMDVLSIMSFFTNIELTVLNSDPWGRGVERLKVNRILSISPKPQLLFKVPKSSSSFSPSVENVNMRDFQIPVKNLKKLVAFLNSFNLAMPLVILMLKPDASSLEKYIVSIIERYFESVNIEKGKLQRLLKFNDAVDVLLKSWILSKLIDIEGFASKNKEFPMKLLIDFTKKVLKGKMDFEYEKVHADIGEIKRLKDKIPADWTLFSEIVNVQKSDQINKRNLIAHSGMLYSITELKLCEEDIYIRLKEEAIKEVINNLS